MVTPARAQAKVGFIMSSPDSAAVCNSSRAVSTASESRLARHCSRLSTASASTSGSTMYTAFLPSICNGLGSLDRYALTPTMVSSPDSMRARLRVSDPTNSCFM